MNGVRRGIDRYRRRHLPVGPEYADNDKLSAPDSAQPPQGPVWVRSRESGDRVIRMEDPIAYSGMRPPGASGVPMPVVVAVVAAMTVVFGVLLSLNWGGGVDPGATPTPDLTLATVPGTVTTTPTDPEDGDVPLPPEEYRGVGFIAPTEVLGVIDGWTSYGSLFAISDVDVAPDGSLWAAGPGGLQVWDASGNVERSFGLQEGLPSLAVRDVAVSRSGSVVVATSAGGISLLEGDTWLTYQAGEMDLVCDGIALSRPRLVPSTGESGQTLNEAVWCFDGAAETLARWDGGWMVYPVPGDLQGKFQRFDHYPFGRSTVMVAPDADSLWLATDWYGLVHFDADTWTWTVYRKAQGLPSASVRDIAIRSDGEVWAATGKGLVAFDGDAWRLIEIDGVDGSSLRAVAFRSGTTWVLGALHQGAGESRPLFGVAASHDGDLWNIVSFYSERLDSVTEFPLRLAVGSHSLWLAIDRDSVMRADVGLDRVTLEDVARPPMSQPQRSRAMAAAGDGRLWVLALNGLWIADGGSWERIDGRGVGGFSDLAIGVDGTVYLTEPCDCDGRGDVYAYKAGSWTALPLPPTPESGERLLAVAPSGDVWITNPGLSVFRDGVWETFDPGLDPFWPNALTVTPDGRVWVAASGGMAASLLSFDGSSWAEVTEPAELGWQHVGELAAAEDGSLWGTFAGSGDSGVFRLADGALRTWSLPSPESLALASDGSVWVSVMDPEVDGEVPSGALYRFVDGSWVEEAGLGPFSAMAITTDALWASSYELGIVRLDLE